MPYDVLLLSQDCLAYALQAIELLGWHHDFTWCRFEDLSPYIPAASGSKKYLTRAPRQAPAAHMTSRSNS